MSCYNGAIMVIKFEKKYLRELYYEGRCTDKKHRFQPDVIERYKRRIDTLYESSGIESLYRLHSLRYEVLSGDKAGISSVRVNDRYRIEFIVSHEKEGEIELTICNIIELSNHYK